MNSNPFGFPQLDPSKMDPQVMMQLSQMIQQLPPDQLGRMQSLMHNAMAGFDVRKDMEAFEKSLPAGFREKLMSVMLKGGTGMDIPSTATPVRDTIETVSSMASVSGAGVSESTAPAQTMNVQEARLTLLRAVAAGELSPEEAERLL